MPATQPQESAPHLSPPLPKAPHARDLSLHHFHPIAGYGAGTEGTPGVLRGAPQKQVLGQGPLSGRFIEDLLPLEASGKTEQGRKKGEGAETGWSFSLTSRGAPT